MKPSDYTSAAKFPLTSQRGLSADKQLLLDAHNLDTLREYAESNRLTADQTARLAELEAKAEVATAVRAALAAGAK